MQKIVLVSVIFALFLTGCGGAKDVQTKEQEATQNGSDTLVESSTLTESGEAVENTSNLPGVTTIKETLETIQEQTSTTTTPQQELGTEEQSTPSIQVDIPSPPTPPKEVVVPVKEMTLYVHGYDERGVTYENMYGIDAYDPLLDTLVELTGFDTLQSYDPNHFTNILTITPYYGKTPPGYYLPQDIVDVENITTIFGGGVPRYAVIIAKYIEHVMDMTGAERVNIISASLGSLITRWMIEKDVEGLASGQKILRWQSVEGVIGGNYVASQSTLMNLVNSMKKQPIDVTHMSYGWIEKYLHTPRLEAASPYYSNILISEISSTKASDPLGWLMKDKPNDGYQAVEDTYFHSFKEEAKFHGTLPVHSYFYQTHLGIKKDLGAWANIATFLLPHKRVRISLVEATVEDIHERTNIFNKKAEIVFASTIYSPLVALKWNINEPICERVYDSGILPVHKYKEDHQTQYFENEVLYDDFLLQEEKSVVVNIEGFEKDVRSRDRLGAASVEIPLQEGLYDVVAKDWFGKVKLEILPTFL